MYFLPGSPSPLIMARSPTRIVHTAFREVSFDNLRAETVVRKLERDERAARRKRRFLVITTAVVLVGLAVYFALLRFAPSMVFWAF